MKPRERRRAQTEAAIIEASIQLLREHGLEGLTIARIARAIDYTPGALYRYFPSKDAIIAELHRRFVTDFEDELQEQLACLPQNIPAISPLLLAAQTYATFARAHPTRFRLLAIGLADPRMLVSREAGLAALPAYLSLYALLSKLFFDALAAGALHTEVPVHDLTLAYVLALQGPLQAHKLQAHAPPTFQTDHLSQQVAEALLHGWGADPTSLSRAHTVLQEKAAESSR